MSYEFDHLDSNDHPIDVIPLTFIQSEIGGSEALNFMNATENG